MSSYLQKCGPGVGTLPQLEPPVVQVVVSNAKNQQQRSDNILPQIANKGEQNNYQTQVRQCRPTAVCVESVSNVLHQRLDMETFSRTNFTLLKLLLLHANNFSALCILSLCYCTG